MSLYDDLDSIKARTTEKVAGWSSGIKLLQSQLQLKKAAITQPKREALRRSTQVVAYILITLLYGGYFVLSSCVLSYLILDQIKAERKEKIM